MNSALIDFGTCIRMILMQDTTLIQYSAIDYNSDSLSFLYSILNEKQIGQVTFCMPDYYTGTLLANSAALSHDKLSMTSGFFCVSIEDLEKLQHLADSLKIPDVRYTERRFICKEDGIYVFEFENIYQMYTVKSGKIIEYDTQTEGLVEQVLQDRCLRYGCERILNYVNNSDMEVLMDTFDNIFTVSDNRTLCDLTYMAALMKADSFSADAYFNSRYINQSIVSDDGYSTPDVPFDDAPDEEITIDSERKQRQKRKIQEDDSDNDEDYVNSGSGGFKFVVLAIIAIMILANFGIFYMCRNQKSIYDAEYAAFVKKSEELQNAKARYSMLSTQAAAEAGSSAYDFLQQTSLLKKSNDVTLNGFSIEGSSIIITVFAKNNNDFMKFYDNIDESYNISNYEEGDSSVDGTEYKVTIIL